MAIKYPDDKWILNRSGRELEGLDVKGTYFMNYALFDETMPRPWGAFFTHYEPKWAKEFDRIAEKVDYAVCMNETIKKYLEGKGVETVIIPQGHDPRVKKKPVFGYSGRFYNTGRKGEELLEGIEYIHSEDFETQPEFYKKIDYLLLPARIEGGPIPLIDAIAAGVPVIAREGVGWVNEFPCIRYKDDEDFKKIINQLLNPPTWEDWRNKHKQLFKTL